MMRRIRDDDGAGVVLAVAVVAVAVALAVAAVGLGAVLAIRQYIGVADAAALAGADVAVGIAAGDPCTVAARVASAGGARMQRCDADGLVVTVTVAGTADGIPMVARSRAGPPS